MTTTSLSDFFSDYRAEWSATLFGELFITPPYFTKLETRGSCILIGGRGTGKTTALRSLRFDAFAERLIADKAPQKPFPYYGIYIRINKNRVRAFHGPQLDSATWKQLFAHYFNIQACMEFCRLAVWLQTKSVNEKIPLSSIAECFNLPPPADVSEFLRALKSSLSQLELYVNNPMHVRRPILSIAEAPVRAFAEAFQELASLKGCFLFCCIDEYENLLDDQQATINTYIKHSEPPLSYKVGVKKTGLRSRATIDSQDVLATPDDYLEIDIGAESFESFAKDVVEHRLSRAKARGITVPDTIEDFLPELTFEAEAKLLDCDRVANEVKQELAQNGDQELIDWAKTMPPSELYFLKYWAEGGSGTIPELARNWIAKPEQWTTRLGNYGYASLFWLSKGRKGARIRKYYSGARTFIGLASGNIRYFIELIDESLHLANESNTEDGTISPAAQTLAARAVGKRRLDQLEGLSEHGSSIKRFVLALGKVFFEFARDPVGRTPEQNAFVISGEISAQEQILPLLHEGVADLAFEVTPKTKATTQSEMRDDEFRLHPIFAPFFEFSHRRKRRIVIQAETLLDVLRHPSRAIAGLLGKTPPVAVEELPQQIALFSSFYGDK